MGLGCWGFSGGAHWGIGYTGGCSRAIEDQYMPQAKVQPTVEDVTRLAFQLSPQDLLRLLQDIQERIYTGEMMAIAEGGFQEWNDPEEDIYELQTDMEISIL
jgi:hypothetical protein